MPTPLVDMLGRGQQATTRGRNQGSQQSCARRRSDNCCSADHKRNRGGGGTREA